MRVASIAGIVVAVGVACTAATPPPSPERAPYPALPFPSCNDASQCAPGEECREGLCWQYNPDGGVAPGVCPQGCAVDELCSAGVCVPTRIDAGTPFVIDRCGGCPLGFVCDEVTATCRTPGQTSTPGTP